MKNNSQNEMNKKSEMEQTKKEMRKEKFNIISDAFDTNTCTENAESAFIESILWYLLFYSFLLLWHAVDRWRITHQKKKLQCAPNSPLAYRIQNTIKDIFFLKFGIVNLGEENQNARIIHEKSQQKLQNKKSILMQMECT